MIKDHIVENVPLFIIMLTVIFTGVKLFILSNYHLRENTMRLYLDSYRIYSEQTIRNTFHNNLKKYYKSSNRINMLFYAVLLSAAVVYGFCQL